MKSIVLGGVLFLAGCGGGGSLSDSNPEREKSYPLHKNITVTIFWTGEPGSGENGHIPNLASAWDDMWMLDFGGVDTPDRRAGYYPAGFVPNENPFYFALPYNDFDKEGNKKRDLSSYIPWAHSEINDSASVCKNRWIKITKEGKSAYAQWEDVGPFGEDDRAYVFGTARPKNPINDHTGLDVSPAVRDYLGLQDIDRVDWEFVDAKDVPAGPWKKIVTVSQVNWIEWYRPDANTSWQWQLNGPVNTSYDVEVYDIDLFDASASLIRSLKESGKRVICYFSAGSWEDWREDNRSFPPEVLGKALDGWPDERWLDIRSDLLRPIMRKRLDLAVEKGCDGVEPDNMDGYTNDTGFDLSGADQLKYNKFIANEARKRGLGVGLKNDLDQIGELEPFFDFALSEECHIDGDCDRLAPFTEANKPVFNAEYARKYVDNQNGERDAMCRRSLGLGLRTLILPIDLDDSFRYSCDE